MTHRFRGRSHNAKKVRNADRRMRIIAGILLREIVRNLPEENPYKDQLDICMKFVNREKYDGHTIDRAMEQVERTFGRPLKILAGNRGYRGQEACGDTKIEIPSVSKPGDTAYAKQKKHNLFRKRAGIEPVIEHCKSDHRLSRNFHKGLFGDSINVIFSAAAFNFKRVMNLFLPDSEPTHYIVDLVRVACPHTEKPRLLHTSFGISCTL